MQGCSGGRGLDIHLLQAGEYLHPKLPDKKFDIIYADPPWDYNGKFQFDKSSKSADEIDLSRNIFISSAVFKYPTLKLEQLVQIPIQEIAKDDCLLFMWTTGPQLVHAIVDLLLYVRRQFNISVDVLEFIWLSTNPKVGVLKRLLHHREERFFGMTGIFTAVVLPCAPTAQFTFSHRSEFQELVNRNAEGFGNFLNVFQRDIFLGTFNHSDIRAMNPGAFGKLLL